MNPPRLPSIVIVGRPNVCKSTLFNAILGQRRSIVGDEPGITRDRIRGEAGHRGRRFELIDTGGIIPHDADLIPANILKQARAALDHAARIVFVIDGRAEITGADRDLARMLRKLGRPVTVAVNKIDVPKRADLMHEFYALGFRDVFPVSAEHKLGLNELLDHLTQDMPAAVPEDQPPEDQPGGQPPAAEPPIRVAIIGRPNVGKSTLLNALVGAERAIVSPIAGTTRDAVDETVRYREREYTFIDTAGIRRKGKTRLMAEKLSVVMARKHLERANVVLMVLDASEGVVGLDATIAGYAHESGRAIVLVVNKWDAAKEKNRKAFTRLVRDQLKFLDYAPLVFVSAKEGKGTAALFPKIAQVFAAANLRIPTGELNRFVEGIDFERDIKVYYMTQAAVRPPKFVVFTDRGEDLHFSTERFIVNRLRKRFGFEGTPIVLKAKRR
jgi:GTP-binding protein